MMGSVREECGKDWSKYLNIEESTYIHTYILMHTTYMHTHTYLQQAHIYLHTHLHMYIHTMHHAHVHTYMYNSLLEALYVLLLQVKIKRGFPLTSVEDVVYSPEMDPTAFELVLASTIMKLVAESSEEARDWVEKITEGEDNHMT